MGIAKASVHPGGSRRASPPARKSLGLSAPESGGHYHEDVCPVEPISSVPANLRGGSKASRPGGITAGGF